MSGMKRQKIALEAQSSRLSLQPEVGRDKKWKKYIFSTLVHYRKINHQIKQGCSIIVQVSLVKVFFWGGGGGTARFKENGERRKRGCGFVPKQEHFVPLRSLLKQYNYITGHPVNLFIYFLFFYLVVMF